jgi:hypothetical protein
MSSASHKRKSNRSPDVAAAAVAPSSSAAAAEAEAEHISKRQRTQQEEEQQREQEEEDRAAEEAEQESAAIEQLPPMTDQQRYMLQAYNVVQGPQRLAGQRTGKPSPAAATVAAEPPPLTAEQLSFHNAGLERWLGVRQGWTLRDASGKALKRNNNAATTATAAAATSPSAVSDSKTQQLDSGRASSGCSSDGHSSGDEFVAGDSSDDDDSSGSDINKHVPRILVARRDYTPFNPRVKLSQMVAILNVCWEEEEDDF